MKERQAYGDLPIVAPACTKFRFVYERDSAIALLRRDTNMMNEKRVWAPQGLPLQACTCQMFLLGCGGSLDNRVCEGGNGD